MVFNYAVFALQLALLVLVLRITALPVTTILVDTTQAQATTAFAVQAMLMLPSTDIALPAPMFVLLARLLQLAVTLAAATEFGTEAYALVLTVLTITECPQLASPVPLHVLLAAADSQLPAQAATVPCLGLSVFPQRVLAFAPLLITILVYSCVSPALLFVLLVGAQPQIALPVTPLPTTA